MCTHLDALEQKRRSLTWNWRNPVAHTWVFLNSPFPMWDLPGRKTAPTSGMLKALLSQRQNCICASYCFLIHLMLSFACMDE